MRRTTPSGATGWVVTTPGATGLIPFAAPLVADGMVFVTGFDGTLSALRASTGGTRWSATTGSGSITGTPALVGGTLVVTNTQSVVTAYDDVSGDVLWTRNGGAAGYSQVTTAGGVAYVCNSTQTIAYDVRTGTILRRLALGANSGGVVVSDGAVFGYDYTEFQLARWDLVDGSASRAGRVSIDRAVTAG